jgi:hypothetical protein
MDEKLNRETSAVMCVRATVFAANVTVFLAGRELGACKVHGHAHLSAAPSNLFHKAVSVCRVHNTELR